MGLGRAGYFDSDSEQRRIRKAGGPGPPPAVQPYRSRTRTELVIFSALLRGFLLTLSPQLATTTMAASGAFDDIGIYLDAQARPLRNRYEAFLYHRVLFHYREGVPVVA